ncbi:biotin biosynthesis protein BioC [Posidoniimonas polymericola]|uniref:Biotin biosynthesis protein BioC n=1 Tax=Posidoniimonas polymericola TaxID=2528002 RepID=A0A5C5XZH0_9BACT|nr:methyltransferase domain-containing protein [Posidoniimonas polymericola]TWT67683.1 biotin biosynthesis protein BioC [Posidoniimonas polymericola]
MRFGEHAQQYRTHAHVQREIAAWCGEWVEPDCRQLSALELGAGTGLFTEILAAKGFQQLTATDLSEQMVAEGNRCVPAARWEQRDAWAPLPEGYDRLYACSLLQWAVDPERVLTHWRRALPSGGRALVAIFVQGSLQEFATASGRFFPVPMRSEAEWLACFRGAGFEVLRHEVCQRVQQHESAIAALRSLHNIGAVANRKLSTAELRTMLTGAEQAHGNGEGFPLTWVTLKAELVVN